MKIESVSGTINVGMTGLNILAKASLSSDVESTTLKISGVNQKAIHTAIVNDEVKSILFLTGDVIKVTAPSDAMLIALLMDKTGIEEIRVDTKGLITAQGSIEMCMDMSTLEYVIRRVDK